MKKTWFQECTRNEIGQADKRSVVLVPVGAIEQHGPHLPVGTDTLILEHLVNKTAETCSVPLLVAPMIAYGYSLHHFCYPGVLSLSSSTLLSMLCDIGNSVIRSGFRRLLFVTGHGGNGHIIGQAVRDISCAHDDVTCAGSSYWEIAEPELSNKMHRYSHWVPGHAGVFETSMICAICESLVDTTAYDEIKDYEIDSETILFSSLRDKAFIERSNYHRSIRGMTDYRIEDASKQLGDELIAVAVEKMVSFVEAFYHHP